jgi:hypothetical protein
MKRYSYSERAYSFGQRMLTLRINIGLLQDFLGLCVQQRVFAPGREEAEIRALWEAAHQKVLLDEVWLSALLKEPSPLQAPVPVEVTAGAQEGSAPTPSRTGLALHCSRDRVRCRVVSVLGLGGIGKSTLVTSDMRQVAEHFQVVLDNLEALLEAGEARGRLRPGYEDYTRLLQAVAETAQKNKGITYGI